MSRFSTPDVEETVGCNLIPMIDIMFLLLLFFMLSADMSSRELEDLRLPEADQIEEEKNVKGPEGVSTANVHHRNENDGVHCAAYSSGQICNDEAHWKISIRSKEFGLSTIGDFLLAEANMELEDPDPANPGAKPLSKRKVQIRADGLAPYGFVQKVFEGCALAGIYKVEIAAAKPMP